MVASADDEAAAASVTAATGKCDVNVNDEESVADVVRRNGDTDVLSIVNGLFTLNTLDGLATLRE